MAALADCTDGVYAAWRRALHDRYAHLATETSAVYDPQVGGLDGANADAFATRLSIKKPAASAAREHHGRLEEVVVAAHAKGVQPHQPRTALFAAICDADFGLVDERCQRLPDEVFWPRARAGFTGAQSGKLGAF